MEILKYNEDKRISACIFFDGIIYEDDSHLGAYILYLKATLNAEEFAELEYNDFEGVDAYESTEVTYGEIQNINNESCFIFFEDDIENQKVIKKYKNKAYLLSSDNDILIEVNK